MAKSKAPKASEALAEDLGEKPLEETTLPPRPPATAVEHMTGLSAGDLSDLCDATVAAIRDGGGFGWLTPPPRQTLETYWKGVLLVPQRQLFVARLDRVIAGAAQLVRPARHNEAQALSARLTMSFVAPWARGHGLARLLVERVESAAQAAGAQVLNLDVRETQARAIRLYEQMGFERWGVHPRYAWVGTGWVAGHFFCKDLTPRAPLAPRAGGRRDERP